MRRVSISNTEGYVKYREAMRRVSISNTEGSHDKDIRVICGD